MNSPIIGKCIYCGSVKEPLTKEHIVPYGLNGQWTMLRASCKTCSDITSAFETDVLSRLTISVRAYAKFQTRHGHPSKFSIDVLSKDGEGIKVVLPTDEYGGVTMLPIFALPASIKGDKSYSTGLNITGLFVRRVGGVTIADMFSKYQAREIVFSVKGDFISFARLLAKIAFGLSVLKYGVDYLDENYVIPAILNQRQDIGKWVGSDGYYNGSEDILIQFKERGGELVAKVILFGKWNPPNYIVVLGRIKTRFK